MASSSDEEEPEKVPDWLMAKRGIQLLINNKADEAETLFLSRSESLHMFAGYSFAVFMDALMSFEEEKLNVATQVLKEVEKRCTQDSSWFRSMKKAFKHHDTATSVTDTIEKQIILADSQVLLAILIILQQDISGYLKGGWTLRKAWKIYQHNYGEVLALYKQHVVSPGASRPLEAVQCDEDSSGPSNLDNERQLAAALDGFVPQMPHSHSSQLANTSSNSSTPNKHNFAFNILKKSQSVNSALSRHASLTSTYFTQIFNSSLKSADVDRDTVQRLMEAISFGYGLFQLGVSLLPPSLLKFTNFLGFGGNRQNGIDCLMYARLGGDMRAPLATLSLLWYHTIVRPFYAIDGTNIHAGVEDAAFLINESQQDYQDSAIFLFFKGRMHRLDGDVPAAVGAFLAAKNNANQRELKMLAMHEVGWCYLIELNFESGRDSFNYLKHYSRWSKPFYTYLAGICCGSCTEFDSLDNIKEIQNGLKESIKNGQLEQFLHHRAKLCPNDDETIRKVTPIYWRMFIYEMLYLWNALPSCKTAQIEAIRQDCVKVGKNGVQEPMTGLAMLILGCCCCIDDEFQTAIASFRLGLQQRKGLTTNMHVSAFMQFELGALLIQHEETKNEGKELLHQISNYKDYDFESRLNVRVHSTLKHM